jgi:acetoacetyl-CoA synthetase
MIHQQMENETVLWEPSHHFKSKSRLNQYIIWLGEQKKLFFEDDYKELWQWSVDKPADFWATVWEYFQIQSHTPYIKVLDGDMPNAHWFEGATLNYAEHIFRGQSLAPMDAPAIVYASEQQTLNSLTWNELHQQVASTAGYLRELGVQKGDRVVAFLPNVPAATIAFLATASLGAVWSSCSPDFGTESVIERFAQIQPKVLFAADGYQYAGKPFDKMAVVADIACQLPTLKKVILLPYLNQNVQAVDNQVLWNKPLSSETKLYFERVAFDAPLFILYSSGTTGIPKAIVHGHGGILLEHSKYLAFHNNLFAGERFFWYGTTGWMMWNFANSALLLGATLVLYDGSPSFPDINCLWQFAEVVDIQHFGTSAPFLISCMKSEKDFKKQFKLKNLVSIGSTGSPLPPEAFEYVYSHIKSDVWLASISGGTDICTAFVGGNPLLPVVKGMIQCRCLGCNILSLNDLGEPTIDEVGEMVIATPMPSMPIYFWNDADKAKYIGSYFEQYPTIWRHGDWVKITEKGYLMILGRSDATLNRHGVRIGTAEIYRVLDKIAEIKDSLIINLELKGGKHYMPLFVVCAEGVVLNDILKQKINLALKMAYSPRHVPDEIIEVNDIPYTISGKKQETPVKKILMGISLQKSINIGSVRNPTSVDFFIDFAKRFEKERII